MSDTPATNVNETSRRDFMRAGAIAGLTAGMLAVPGRAHLFAGESDVIRVGLVGCGGRGTGAAGNALTAEKTARLVAVGDAFAETIEPCLQALKGEEAIADRVVVDDDHKFVGLDAYRHVVDACDVVLLAAPPGFRPEHFEYAVERGKDIFCEKPVATDSPGLRRVAEAVKKSKEKNLRVVSGFCWRYDNTKRAFFEKILSGAIGENLCTYTTYLTGPVKPMVPASQRPEGMSDFEWQVRNWYNFTWLSGDGLVEQAVHAVDWVGWAKGDTTPLSCTAVGGRQIPAEGGDIFDHIEVNYLWPDRTRAFVAQRQITGCYNENSCYVLGSHGKGEMSNRGALIEVNGEKTWRPQVAGNNMYVTEHEALFNAIIKNETINDGDRMVNSTLMGLMGRMAGYTGKEITADMCMNSEERLVPEITGWETPVETRRVPLPGINL